MKFVSFSLWGEKLIYNVGAVRNAELINKIYNGWKMVLYYNSTVPKNTIERLNKLKVELIDMSDSKIHPSMWRFTCCEKKNSEFSIFRDCDSRISMREKFAVDDWIKSNKTIHIMRDHPAHRMACGARKPSILAGMWGYKGVFEGLTDKILNFQKENKIENCYDQLFLKDIYEKYINDNCTHDEFLEKKPFPTKREDTLFVGGRIDENDKPVGEQHLRLLKYDNKLRIGGV